MHARNEEKFWCPTNDWSCPYLNGEDGSCTLLDKGYDPVLECDTAMYYCSDDDEDE